MALNPSSSCHPAHFTIGNRLTETFIIQSARADSHEFSISKLQVVFVNREQVLGERVVQQYKAGEARRCTTIERTGRTRGGGLLQNI